MKGKFTIAFVAVAGLLLSVGLVGVGAAQTYENVNGTDMPINETVSPTEDTESIRVIGQNITNGTADVFLFEIENGNETQVSTGTLNTSDSSVTSDTFEYSMVNTSLEYRVHVEGDGAELLDIAKVNVVSAGGGGGFGSSLSAVPKEAVIGVLLALIIAGGVVVSRRF